jgi:S-adenosylmethionine decarboxylase
MHGIHLTADLKKCQCEMRWFTDADGLMQRCMVEVQAAGLQAVAQLAHTFPSSAQGKGGVTATVLLAESHLCIHTWPEIQGVTLDVYVCNRNADHTAKAQTLLAALQSLFEPHEVMLNSLHRGSFDDRL